jgi:cellulase
MGELPASGKTEDVEFFKIDEASYDPKTQTFGTDWLIKNNNYWTSVIPSDIKPGTYVVRHELISLHNALNDDYIKKSSGAQHYPQCVKIKVTGDGKATPKGKKFPGTYKWDDKGILVNLYWRPNEYTAPGGPVYKPAV